MLTEDRTIPYSLHSCPNHGKVRTSFLYFSSIDNMIYIDNKYVDKIRLTIHAISCQCQTPLPLIIRWFTEILTPIMLYQAISLWRFFFTSFIKNLVNIDPHNFVTDIGGNSLSNRWVIKQLNHRQLFTSCKATFLQFMDFLLLLKHLMRLTWVGNVPYRIHKIILNSFSLWILPVNIWCANSWKCVMYRIYRTNVRLFVCLTGQSKEWKVACVIGNSQHRLWSFVPSVNRRCLYSWKLDTTIH